MSSWVNTSIREYFQPPPTSSYRHIKIIWKSKKRFSSAHRKEGNFFLWAFYM